ncbi:hypothetical protein, partial [Thomasclavelia ramosa]
PLSKPNVYANDNICPAAIENNNYSSTRETIYYNDNDFSSRYKVLKNGKKYYMKILDIWEIVINSKGYLCNSFMIRFQKRHSYQ